MRRLLATIFAVTTASAQPYLISTFAGGAPLRTPISGLSAPLDFGGPITADSAGNVYVESNEAVFRLDQRGILTQVAGNGRGGYSGDGGSATDAQISFVRSLALDAQGNLFISDLGNHRIRRVSPGGIITTIVGDGAAGTLIDGVPAVSSHINPDGIAVDFSGNLFIVDQINNVILKVASDGIITTYAGNHRFCSPSTPPCPTGDGGPALEATLFVPMAVAADSFGNLYLAEPGRVRKIAPNGIITTYAGGGAVPPACPTCLGDGGPATGALVNPVSLAADASGNLFIADGGYGRIRKVAPNGIITTVAGNGVAGPGGVGPITGDGGPAINASLSYISGGIALDGAGTLYISAQGRIRKIETSGIINTVAGKEGAPECCSDDGGPATAAQIGPASSLAVDAAGDVFIADPIASRVRKVSPDGTITTVAGNGACFSPFNSCPPVTDGVPAVNEPLHYPSSVAVDLAGNLFIADISTNRVREVSPDGMITTAAQLDTPSSVATDSAGNLFVVYGLGRHLRKISADGTNFEIDVSLNTIDLGGCDYPGGGMVTDPDGNLFVADTLNNRILEISPIGVVTTVAGNGAVSCAGDPKCSGNGDGGPATSARLSPSGVVLDGSGNMFITDGPSVRKISAAGTITTVAGGKFGYSGDGGPATAATFGWPGSIAIDAYGNIYIADSYNQAVRVLRPAKSSALVTAVVEAASQRVAPISAGEIVVLYGVGLGPAQMTTDPNSGTQVFFNGAAAQILYSSATQVAALVPSSITGTAAQVTVSYQGQKSNDFDVTVATSSPGLFTLDKSGTGQAAAVNLDGTVNTAANPVKIGSYISLYATGWSDLKLPVNVNVGGIPATIQYAGNAPAQPGVMQINVQVPSGVSPGGYVPIVLKVGDASTTNGAVWIAVVEN